MAFKGRQMWKIWLLKLFVLIISSPYKRQSNILLVVIQNLGRVGGREMFLLFTLMVPVLVVNAKKTTKQTSKQNQQNPLINQNLHTPSIQITL